MVTRLIDLFVDIAVLLSPGKLVYTDSQVLFIHLPRLRTPAGRVAGHVYHAVTEMSARIATYTPASVPY